MDFSFTVLLTLTFFSGILIILLWIMLHNNQIIQKAGISSLFIGLLLVLFRLLMPVEFPFARNVPIRHILPDITLFLENKMLYIGTLKLSILQLMHIIWALGIIILLIKFLFEYLLFKRKVGLLPPAEDIELHSALQEVLADFRSHKNFRIVIMKNVTTPMLFGIQKPYIIIPSLNLTKDEWYYVLKHEITHYCKGDLWIKLLVEYLCIFYWWNPFIYLLKKQAAKAIELHTDYKITDSFDDIRKIEYFECILKIAKNQAKDKSNKALLTLTGNNASVLSQRLHVTLTDYSDISKFTFKHLAVFLTFLFLTASSFLFVFEPYAISPYDESTTFELNEQNAYLVVNPDGGYDLYYKKNYLVTVHEIENSYSGLHIYNNINEVKNNEKNK
ncbi:M56 family metallopeptidase [Anaerocolumna jejuensis]|uniref:M56 family metallopeptidase n=1 Tax=Anaerocolumna jejuensis TaxID=259063 RepID=UPI003F7BFE21